MSRTLVIPLASLALLCVAAYHVTRNSQAEPELEPPVAPARSPFGEAIAGSGIVEPWTENIALGTHTPGIVQEVCVVVGQEVLPGAPLFRVDERQLRADLAVREARLAAAQAQLDRLDQQPRPEELPGSAARVREAEARCVEEQDRFDRSARLMERRIISEEDYASRRQSLAVAREQLAKARADDELLRAGAWEPDKAVARATVEQMRAEVEQARTDLSRLTVTAPIAGRILQVNVRTGEHVAQSSASPLLILGHLDPLHVRVDIDESDLPRFRPGAPARGFARSDTEHAIELEFVRVEPYVIPKKSLTGESSERVDTRVLPVIYAVRSGEVPLHVGQQLDVFVNVPSSRESTDQAQVAGR